MARKFPQSKGLNRKGASKQPKLTIYAYCEGKNTEPDYLQRFAKLHGNGLVRIVAEKAQGVPLTLCENAAKKKRDLDKLAKKSKDPLDLLFEVWAVFDCDEHPKIKESMQLTQANNISVAYSNPCFEIWPLLHFKNQTAYIHRHEAQKQLATFLSDYAPNGSKTVFPAKLAGYYEDAKNRAIQLERAHQSAGAPMSNPYTDIFVLLDKIIANGRT